MAELWNSCFTNRPNASFLSHVLALGASSRLGLSLSRSVPDRSGFQKKKVTKQGLRIWLSTKKPEEEDR